jgi:hypothetical protein
MLSCAVLCCAVFTQGYDACTWESEQSPALMQPEHIQLLLQLWERQRRAMARAGEEGCKAERAALALAERTPMAVSGLAACREQLLFCIQVL